MMEMMMIPDIEFQPTQVEQQAFNVQLESDRLIVDSGGSRDITTDASLVYGIQKLKTPVKFKFLKGSQSADRIALRDVYVPAPTGDRLQLITRVVFLMEPSGTGSRSISILSTGQGKVSGIGFYQVPHRQDFLAIYKDGTEVPRNIPTTISTPQKHFRFAVCDRLINGLPILRVLSAEVVQASSLPLVSFLTGQYVTPNVRAELRRQAIAKFNETYATRSPSQKVFYTPTETDSVSPSPMDVALASGAAATSTKTTPTETYNVMSLCSGLGPESLMSLPRLINGERIEGVPIKLVVACEKDPLLRVHIKSQQPGVLLHSDIHLIEDDIRTGRFNIDSVGQIHIVILTSPCTGRSFTRLRPAMVVVEMTDDTWLKDRQSHSDLDHITDLLRQEHYKVKCDLLQTHTYGDYQHRDRFILIASAPDAPYVDLTPSRGLSRCRKVADVLDPPRCLPPVLNVPGHLVPYQNHRPKTAACLLGHVNGQSGKTSRVYSIHGIALPCYTQRNIIIHDDRLTPPRMRYLTVAEAARLSSFPESTISFLETVPPEIASGYIARAFPVATLRHIYMRMCAHLKQHKRSYILVDDVLYSALALASPISPLHSTTDTTIVDAAILPPRTDAFAFHPEAYNATESTSTATDRIPGDPDATTRPSVTWKSPVRKKAWPSLPNVGTATYVRRQHNAMKLQQTYRFLSSDAMERYLVSHPSNRLHVQPGDSRLIPTEMAGCLEPGNTDTVPHNNKAKVPPWYGRGLFKPGECLHMDGLVFGVKTSYTKTNAVIIAMDDYSTYLAPYYQNCSAARDFIAALNHYKRLYKSITGNDLKLVITDMQSSFVSKEASNFRLQTGIQLEVVPAGCHYLRGKIESKMRYLLKSIRSRLPMLRGLVIKQRPIVQTATYWDLALQHAIQAHNDNSSNYIVTRHGGPYTSEELARGISFDGRSPFVLREFGERGYDVPEKRVPKHLDKVRLCIYVANATYAAITPRVLVSNPRGHLLICASTGALITSGRVVYHNDRLSPVEYFRNSARTDVTGDLGDHAPPLLLHPPTPNEQEALLPRPVSVPQVPLSVRNAQPPPQPPPADALRTPLHPPMSLVPTPPTVSVDVTDPAQLHALDFLRGKKVYHVPNRTPLLDAIAFGERPFPYADGLSTTLPPDSSLALRAVATGASPGSWPVRAPSSTVLYASDLPIRICDRPRSHRHQPTESNQFAGVVNTVGDYRKHAQSYRQFRRDLYNGSVKFRILCWIPSLFKRRQGQRQPRLRRLSEIQYPGGSVLPNELPPRASQD